MTKSLCVTIFFQREGDRLCICRLMTFNAYDRLTAVNIATEFQLSSKKRFAACRFIQKTYTSKKKCRDRKKNHLETNQAGSRTECGAIPPYPSHSRKSRVVPVECWLHRSIGPTVGSLDEPRFIPYILFCLPVTAAKLQYNLAQWLARFASILAAWVESHPCTIFSPIKIKLGS